MEEEVMNTIAILTPSFLPDIDGFTRLHQSVLRYTDEHTVHHAIVPRRDLRAFREIESPRLRVWSESDFLPRGLIATDGLAALRRRIPILPRTINCSALNLRRPWPPIRGWVLQQILKLSAATQLETDAVVIIDSDVVLIRSMPAEAFFRERVVRLYEKPNGITPELARHSRWTRTAYELLGLPWSGEVIFPDYVGGIVSWDPELTLSCLNRVAAVAGTDWATAVAKQLHFSEFILYGTYVRHFGTAQQRSFCAATTLCHSYWSSAPLSFDGARSFAAELTENDVAIHIQSNSHTEPTVVDSVISALSGSDQL
jgi:hypothetical protein